MKTKQEFITEFVLRTMTNPDVAAINTESERDMLEWAIGLANRVWDAIENNVKPSNLVDLAKKAISEYRDGKYIAQDRDGYWAVYKSKPVLNQSVEGLWREGLAYEASYVLHKDAPPADYTQECYRISDILGTE